MASAYQALLRRDAEPGGIAYWSGQLDAGTSRGDVLGGILLGATFLAASIAWLEWSEARVER